jgi:hypothetical protein
MSCAAGIIKDYNATYGQKFDMGKVLKDFLIRGVLSLSLPVDAGPSDADAGPP